MRRKYVIINSFIILVGIIFFLIGIVISGQSSGDASNKGDSFFGALGIAMVTGGITSLLTTLILDEAGNANSSMKTEWGMVQIYEKRSEMNVNCDKYLSSCRKNLDFISLGLKNFRDAATDTLMQRIRLGVRVRIITSNPQSKYLRQKAIEEGSSEESIRDSIKDLIYWAQGINSGFGEKVIEIKLYDSLPMFSYQRIDEHIFLGPNLYGLSSQKTISYEYDGGRGFDYFSKYFDKLWNDKKIVSIDKDSELEK